MRKVIMPLILIFGLAFIGIWFYAQHRLSQELANYAADPDPAFQFAEHDVAGFPMRLRATLTDATLRAPDTGLEWRMPHASAGVSSISPNQVIVELPPVQTFDTGLTTLTLQSTDLQATSTVGIGLFLPLKQITLTGNTLSLFDDPADPVTAEQIDISFDSGAGERSSYDLTGALTAITLPDGLRATIDPDAALPAQMEGVTLAAVVGLSAPITRAALHTPPKLERIDLQSLALTWGPMQIAISGVIDIDPQGLPTGALTATIAQYEVMLERATAAGWIPGNQRFAIEAMTRGLASGQSDLSVPLTITNGEITLGGLLPLGRIEF